MGSEMCIRDRREARALCGFQHHKGENLFCFLFSDPIILGLSSIKNSKRGMSGDGEQNAFDTMYYSG